MTFRSGLHGLFRLDGGPINPVDAKALDLPIVGSLGTAAARGVDAAAPEAIHRSDADGRLTILAGSIDEADILAGRLGLPSRTPRADLARAALQRFGAQTPAEMLGEWTLLHWNPEGRLALMASAARRDRLFYAISGNRCAVSSDLFRLARIAWIGREINEAGLLFQLGRAKLRSFSGTTTMIEGVRQLTPGGSVAITHEGVELGQANALTPQPPWGGTFEEACDAAEALLGRVLRDRIANSPAPAVLLSGGLDSSLLAWAVAEQMNSGRRLHLLTSVAPPGSGLPDESEFAGVVAAALGLSCERVWPPEEANPYRPPPHIMASANGAMLSNRQPLTDSFQTVAREIGATLLLNGTYGEYTLTGRPYFSTWRQRARGALSRLRHGSRLKSASDGFHVRLAPHRLALLPEEIRAAMAPSRLPPTTDPPPGRWGYHPGIDRALGHANEFFAGALRMEFPYRDVRLLRLFAGMPTSFLVSEGIDRAPVRRILTGRLPDSIRLRRRGMPASPDHMVRLRQKAPAARARIDMYRSVDLDEWFDLNWLDQALIRVAERGPADVAEANMVLATAINAELLAWWRSGGLTAD